MSQLKLLLDEFQKLADPEKAKNSAWFFKTGPGEYGEGDVFIGITVPIQRRLAQKYKALELGEIEKLLSSKIHEHRLTALFILRKQYEASSDSSVKSDLADFYLKNKDRINNWDLVDSSAHYILGDYLSDKPKDIIYKLAKSSRVWDRRVAVLTTFAFIKDGQFEDSLELSKMLLNDPHDLMHKAIGWMLREIGNKDEGKLVEFLNAHAQEMPRTMLRYSIEKLPEAKRKSYLAIKRTT